MAGSAASSRSIAYFVATMAPPGSSACQRVARSPDQGDDPDSAARSGLGAVSRSKSSLIHDTRCSPTAAECCAIGDLNRATNSIRPIPEFTAAKDETGGSASSPAIDAFERRCAAEPPWCRW